MWKRRNRSCTIDEYSRFIVYLADPGVIAILADNDKFWSRINRATGYNPIEAAKTRVDNSSLFICHNCVYDGWKNVQTIERSY